MHLKFNLHHDESIPVRDVQFYPIDGNSGIEQTWHCVGGKFMLLFVGKRRQGDRMGSPL